MLNHQKTYCVLSQMHSSGGGGCCDCGDEEAWKRFPACSEHTLSADHDAVSLNMSDFSLILIKGISAIALAHCPTHLFLEKKKSVHRDTVLEKLYQYY